MKTVLITGASGGIGAACAKAFSEAGMAVMVHYHQNKVAAEAVYNQIVNTGGHASIAKADIADPMQAEQLVHITEQNLGGVDILINNAGIALSKMFCDTTPAEWERIFAVNMGGMAHVTRAVLPYMVRQKSGHIINLSSIWGMTGGSCEVAYSASKSAVIGFTKALAKELGPSNILVNCVAPGVIDTEMNAHLDEESIMLLKDETPLGKIGTPMDIAKLIVYLTSSQNQFITGQVVSPNGGLVI
ncbi:MAG: SDR family oxidoreductase [Ruminococcaceae bacterium]|nr:SDR family oxidoreductase [Oscillospiraceae bacterium]